MWILVSGKGKVLAQSQQEVDSLTLVIDRAVEIAPLTNHFDIGFIDSPG